MIEFLTEDDRVLDVIAYRDGQLVSGPFLRDVAFAWLRQGKEADEFEDAYASWNNGYVRARRVNGKPTVELRPVMTPALVAAGDFDESKVKRDGKGRFAKKAGLKNPLKGKKIKITHGLVHKTHAPGTVIAISGSDKKRVVWDGNKYLLQEKDEDGGWPTKKTAIKSKAYKEIGDFADGDWHAPANDGDDVVPDLAVDTANAPSVKSGPSTKTAGSPLKITHGLVHKKHQAGDIIAENGTGDKRVVWDGDKYRLQSKTSDGKWTTDKTAIKSKAYKEINDFDSDWRTPKSTGGSDDSTPSAAPSTEPPKPKSQKSKTVNGVETKPGEQDNGDDEIVSPFGLPVVEVTPANGKKDPQPGDKVKIDDAFFENANFDVGDIVVASGDKNKRVIFDGDDYRLQSREPGDSKWTTEANVPPDEAVQRINDFGSDWRVPEFANIWDQKNFENPSAGTSGKTGKTTGTPAAVKKTTATPASPPADANAPDPVAKPKTSPVKVDAMDSLTNGVSFKKGKLFEDSSGKADQYVKVTQTTTHAQNEFLAANLYVFANQKVEQTSLVELDPAKMDGKTGIGVKTKMTTAAVPLIDAMKNDPNVRKQVLEGFAIDAWLGNWDVVGMGYDNIKVDDNGNVQRTNLGGSLLFRANGMPKGLAFGDTVGEIDSLRNPTLNPTAAKIFADVSDDDIRAGVKHIEAMTPEIIDFIVANSFDGPEAESIKKKLKARRQDLINKYGSNAPKPANSSGPAPSTQPTATNALNTGGPKVFTAAQKAKVYAVFNNKKLKWHNKTPEIYNAALEVSQKHSDLTIGDALDIMDQSLKKKTGNPFRTKVEKWLKTNAGKSHVVSVGGSASIGSTSSTVPGATPSASAPSGSSSNVSAVTGQSFGKYKKLSKSDANALQKKMDEQFPPPWTTEQRNALRTYTGGSYTMINKCARGTGPCDKHTLDLIKNIKAGMKPSTSDVVVFRKTGHQAFGLEKLDDIEGLAGKVINDDGVISTSIRSNIWDGSLHLEIEAPKGSMMAWVQPISLHPSEDEIVIAPGTHYEVVTVTKQTPSFGKPFYVVRLRIIPGSDAQSADLKKAKATT